MNYTLPGLIFLVVIAAVCGAIGRAIAGGVRGGLIVSTALGFIGALIGPWLAVRASLPGAVVDHRRRGLRGHRSPVLQALGRRGSRRGG
jgi:hypothetical protein